MVLRSPLVIISGVINQLPPGDSIGGETDPVALASGNAALEVAVSNRAALSGYSIVPSGAFDGTSASLVFLQDGLVGSQVNLSGQGGLQLAQVGDVITVSGGTGAGGGGGGAVGSGTEQAFFLNVIQISGSYTIPSGFNAGTFGPVDVLSGVTITSPSGSTWTVV